MEFQEERRRYSRFRADGTVYIVGETADGPFEVRGRLNNVSSCGMAVSLADRLPVGSIVWCAAPAHGLYERGQVCHSGWSLLASRATGIRFLAPPPQED